MPCRGREAANGEGIIGGLRFQLGRWWLRHANGCGERPVPGTAVETGRANSSLAPSLPAPPLLNQLALLLLLLWWWWCCCVEVEIPVGHRRLCHALIRSREFSPFSLF